MKLIAFRVYDVQILVQFEMGRKIVRVPSTGSLEELRAAVLAEFDGILLPQSKVIFQIWDDDFSDYVDFEEGVLLKGKDKRCRSYRNFL